MASANKKIIIITAPSGAGKTSITRYLLERFPQLSFSISATTRSPRENEVDGKDYYFISIDAFKQKIQSGEFVEWEMVYEGKYYGTLKTELVRLWKEKKCPLLDIDVKGAIHIQQQYPDSTLSIFIEPPSVRELARRLASRGTETEESLQTRINKAEYEMSFSHHFDHIVVNDDLQEACEEAEKLVSEFLNK
ncbi:Guanylate kinase [Mycovorax composti]|jgi:guanylate kinase|uniref:Guanylate kinase n=2 Tax=Chitinophagaceae TaxID=563835 RepID=A0ABZ2EH91_9BACT